jgi:hypothetical protein
MTKTPLLLLAWLLAPVIAAGQDPRPVFDARLSPAPAKIAAADTALLDRLARPAARQAWKGSEGCKDEFEVLDAVTGAFTRRGASQRAFLYRFCTTGHGFGASGVAVIEDGKTVAHLAYDGAADYALGALPDLDGDGLSEILLVGGGTNQGITATSVSLIGIGVAPGGVKKLGRFPVYEDNCGAGTAPGATAWRLLARPGPKPVFSRERFVRKSCEEGAWQQVGEAEAISPEADDTRFRRLAP